MTPRRKHIGKAVARKSHQKIALECCSDPAIKKHILKRIGQEIRNELITMSSDKVESVMHRDSKIELERFSWEKILDEVSANAPVLLNMLTAITKTKTKRSNTQAIIIGMCIAILLKHRSRRMNLVQKIVSLILYNGSASKQVYNKHAIIITSYLFLCL